MTEREQYKKHWQQRKEFNIGGWKAIKQMFFIIIIVFLVIKFR